MDCSNVYDHDDMLYKQIINYSNEALSIFDDEIGLLAEEIEPGANARGALTVGFRRLAAHTPCRSLRWPANQHDPSAIQPHPGIQDACMLMACAMQLGR